MAIAHRRCRARTSSAIRRAASGLASARRGRGHRLQPRLVAEQRRRPRARQPLGAQLGVGDHRRRAGLAPSRRRWRSGGRRSRAGRGRGSPAGRPRSPRRSSRPSGPRTRSQAARHVAEVGLVVEQRVALGVRRRGEALLAARRSRGGRRGGGRGSRGPLAARRRPRSRRRLIERAPWLPPITSRQRASAAIPNRARARAAVGLEHRRRHRPAGDQVALALAARRSGRRGRPAAPVRPAAGWRGRGGCRPRSGPAACGASTAARPGRARRRSRRRP